jgi:hypothetical protein
LFVVRFPPCAVVLRSRPWAAPFGTGPLSGLLYQRFQGPREIRAAVPSRGFFFFEYNRRAAVEVDGPDWLPPLGGRAVLCPYCLNRACCQAVLGPAGPYPKAWCAKLDVGVTPFCKKVTFYGQPGAFRAWTTYMRSVSPGWGEMLIDSGGAKPGV